MKKAVLCDAGHVLFDDSGIKNVPYELVRQFIPDLSLDDFLDVYTKYKRKAQTLPDYSSENAMHDYLHEIGRADILEKLPYARQPSPKPLYPREGVAETLKALKEKGIDFIIMTDATKKGDELRPALKTMGLDEYVADVVSSKDTGVIKPDIKFFDMVLMRNGLQKEECVFVGHDLDELKGAHELGYDVYAVYCDNDFLPEKKLNDFKDILQGLNS